MKTRGHAPAKLKYWSRHIEMWKSSGLHQKEYCEKLGLGLKSFGRWKGILAKQTIAVPRPTVTPVPGKSGPLIPLSVIPDQPTCHASFQEPQNSAGIRIHVDKCVIDLSVGFHVGTLQALLGMLEAA